MEVYEAIQTRRSVRHFTGEPVSDAMIEKVLRAGFQAPSAHNLHPQHYLVVRDKEKIAVMAERHKYAKMLPAAGCSIIVLGDQNVQDREGFLIADCSAAIENMLLAAHAEGLGAVWLGLHPIEGFVRMIRSLFDFPDHMLPIGMMALGHQVRTRTPIDRFDPERVHYETW